uniref:Glia maturation factor gamma n=1 Tax=Panagrellus redivivus TaxID=6233 RepID=A0A7E4VUM1_PANRE
MALRSSSSGTQLSIEPHVLASLRAEEQANRVHTDALGRLNSLRRDIGEAQLERTPGCELLSDGVFEIVEKNAELHILSTPATRLYYYYEHVSRSWLFLERDNQTGSSTLYSCHRANRESPPKVQTLVQ